MRVEDLVKLFSSLPDFFVKELEGKELTTCWYASPYLDVFPMELLDSSHPSSVTKESVDVFFYPDIDFIPLPEGFYTHHSKGKIRFPQVEKWSGEIDDLYARYERTGKVLAYNLKLRNDGIVPSADDDVVQNSYKSKNIFREKLIEFHQICKDLLRRQGEDISEWGGQEELDNRRLDIALEGAYMGPKLDATSLEIIRAFLDLKYSYAEESAVDFSACEFNACLVEHEREDGSPFYTFYIDIDDSSFEKILLTKELQIDFVAFKNTYDSGPGPRALGNLGCRYVLGECGGSGIEGLPSSLPEGHSFIDFRLDPVVEVVDCERKGVFAAVVVEQSNR